MGGYPLSHLVPILKNEWSHTFSLAYVFVECIATPFTFNFQALIGVSLPRVKIPVVQPIVSGRGGDDQACGRIISYVHINTSSAVQFCCMFVLH